MVLGRSGFFVIKVVRVLEVCADGGAWRSDGRENAIVREWVIDDMLTGILYSGWIRISYSGWIHIPYSGWIRISYSGWIRISYSGWIRIPYSGWIRISYSNRVFISYSDQICISYSRETYCIRAVS